MLRLGLRLDTSFPEGVDVDSAPELSESVGMGKEGGRARLRGGGGRVSFPVEKDIQDLGGCFCYVGARAEDACNALVV